MSAIEELQKGNTVIKVEPDAATYFKKRGWKKVAAVKKPAPKAAQTSTPKEES